LASAGSFEAGWLLALASVAPLLGSMRRPMTDAAADRHDVIKIVDITIL
jgi:hypothetical protein